MTDILNKPIKDICKEYSDDGLLKLLPTLKEGYNRFKVMQELMDRDIIVPPLLPGEKY